jgi:hypothetical protein
LHKITNLLQGLFHHQQVDIQHDNIGVAASGIAALVMRPAGWHPNEIAPAVGSEQRHPALGGVINLNENAIVSGADSILKIHDVEIPPDNSLFLVHHYACTHDFMSFD